MAADKTYRVGMIGVGRKGHGHARGYEGNPRTEIVAGADSDASNLEIFLERFPVTGYADYKKMLEREELDILAPILPVKPNAQVVIDCARTPGVKAIYCEKPMALSLEESDNIVEECASRGIHLASGDAYRNMPQHWKVKRLIDSGELGEVQSINLYQSTNEISGGGCQGLSVLRLFADDADVNWVVGWCGDDPSHDNDQNMAGHVRFKNGIEAYIHGQRGALEGIEVICSEGVYHTNWSTGHLWRGKAHAELEEDFSTNSVTAMTGSCPAAPANAAASNPSSSPWTRASSHAAAAPTCARCSKSPSACASHTATASPRSTSRSPTAA